MEDSANLAVLSVTTTVASLDQAQALAREIIGQRLAACVQLEPGLQSLYRWGGQLCEEAEVRLTIKTLPAAAAALQALLAQRHPYDLPQVLSCTLQASPAYAQWVRSEVTLPAAPAAVPAPAAPR
jgi:periplasmic divalent cation tolerance protein